MDLIECPNCDGYGGFSHPHRTCNVCNGKGRVPACENCYGHGEVGDGRGGFVPCDECDGSGVAS